jgi:D-galactarolactone cycloisomerase
MKIVELEAFPVRLPRDRDAAVGTAGSPTALAPGGAYRWSDAVNALYPVHFETALVRVATEGGAVGWGEAQAPLAPEVACTIVNLLLKPAVVGAEFSGEIEQIRALWQRMYSTMRIRGQTGGFMLDAISGVDLALWDLAGKLRGLPVCRMIAGGDARRRVPAYLSGLPGAGVEERLARARAAWDAGFRIFKVFYDADPAGFWAAVRALRAALGPEARIAIDALWRLTPDTAAEFGHECDRVNAHWLEAPLPPEDPLEHGRLAAAIETPVALGESYRTLYELRPFFEVGAVTYVQPDVGRCGLTEGLRIADQVWELGKPLVPHLSIAFGPQIAAAIHYAASTTQCDLLEYNPAVLETANRFLVRPIAIEGASYVVPDAPGLGIEMRETELQAACGLA